MRVSVSVVPISGEPAGAGDDDDDDEFKGALVCVFDHALIITLKSFTTS